MKYLLTHKRGDPLEGDKLNKLLPLTSPKKLSGTNRKSV